MTFAEMPQRCRCHKEAEAYRGKRGGGRGRHNRQLRILLFVYLSGEREATSASVLWASFEDQLKASDTSRKPAEIWLKNSHVQTAQKKPNLGKDLLHIHNLLLFSERACIINRGQSQLRPADFPCQSALFLALE